MASTPPAAEGREAEEEEDLSAEESEEEEEIEPKLSYERLRNDVPKILIKDAASCIAIHTKFLALGTHLGVIHILDHQGNNIHEKELILHVTTVNQISIDDRGDYLASCSNDGKVVLHGLYSSDLNTSVTIDRPVRSIALDPLFSKSSSNRRFIIGEDKVVLYEKFFLSRYKPTILYQGEGPIRNIKWRDRFVVWSSDKTVRVYDLGASVTIVVIQRDCDPKLRPDLYRCNFFWKDDRTLLVGWADRVKVCRIVETQTQTVSFNLNQVKDQPPTPHFCVVITSIFNTDFCICGISAIENDIVVLTVLKDTEISGNSGLRPQVRVLEPLQEDFRPISKDVLMLHGYQEYRCNDYHLDSLASEGLYFILSPKDFVVARPRDEDDHISWLIQHELFKEAVDAILESKKLKRFTLLQVGQLYLDHLLQTEQYDEAPKLCPVIFGENKKLWEEELYKFAQICQLRQVASYLPIEDPLDQTIYEMVLNEYLQFDPPGFLNLIEKWPCHLYKTLTIISAVRDRMSTLKSPCIELEVSLCELLIYDGRYKEALSHYISIFSKLKDRKYRVFKLIQKYNLFGEIHDKLEVLMEHSPAEATALLVNHIETIPVDLVVMKLKNRPKLLFEYLCKLVSKDPTLGEEHHGLLVELYAEFEPKQLIVFLRSSNSYALEVAFNVCQQRNLTNEMIYLLGRMGNTKQALQQITQELQDINRAIEFCKEHNDQELWEDLIECSLKRPDFITVLLQNIGTHVDPIILIKKIPSDLKIPGLRDSLVKILQDYKLQISLREGCEKILVTDCFSLLEKLDKSQKRGIFVGEDHVCQACHRKLLTNDPRKTSQILVFSCKHSFHEDCADRKVCKICSAQKRGPSLIQNIK